MKESNEITDETRIWAQIKKFGINKLIFSTDTALALTVAIILFIDYYFRLGLFVHVYSPHEVTTNYVTGVLAAGSALFAIVLAALAIILSFSSNGFVSFLRKKNKLNPLIFIFWLGNIAYLVSIGLSSVFLILNPELIKTRELLYILDISIFTYAVINTFYILGAVIRFGLFLQYFEEMTQDKK